MPKVDVKKITGARLSRWGNKLISEHATPALLLGIGHDHVSGRIILCVTEDRSDTELIAFLEAAIIALKNPG